MFAYISGKFTLKTPTYIIIDASGIGYGAHITLQTYEALAGKEEGKIWIHAHIKEDAFDLYGFATENERDMFRHLVSVSGIGPNTARIILSAMTFEETRNAILTEDELAFKRVKGVGPKTAKRVILDLKDKVAKETSSDVIAGSMSVSQPTRSEAMAALLALGFNRNEVIKALNKISSQSTQKRTTEELIKEGLRMLSGGR